MEVTIDLEKVEKYEHVCVACSEVYACDNMGFFEECPLYKITNKDKKPIDSYE